MLRNEISGYAKLNKTYVELCEINAKLSSEIVQRKKIEEELIRQHTNRHSHIIVMLDENEAGQSGREDIACRLSKFCFVRVHQFSQPDMEPEHLTTEEVQQLMEGVL